MPEKPERLAPVTDPHPGVVYANRDGSTYSRPEPVVLLSAERLHLYERRGRLRIESASVARRGATRGGLMAVWPNLDQPSDLEDGDAQSLLAVHARVGGDVVNLGKYGEPAVNRHLPDSFWVMGHLPARHRDEGDKYPDTVRPETVAHLSDKPVYDWAAANEAWVATRARQKAADEARGRVVAETDRQAERARAWAAMHGFTNGDRRSAGDGWTLPDMTVRSLRDNEVVLRTDVLVALLAAAGVPDLAAQEG